MARLLDENQAAKDLAEVSKFADKNQRLAWRRKHARIEELISRLEPLQEERLALLEKMQPIIDQIEEVRTKMIDECVHPVDHLVHKATHIECKFCNTKIQLQK